MSVTRSAFCVALVWLAGCSCQDREHASTANDPPPIETPAAVDALPSARRSDLPEASPAITILVDERTFAVSNRALVETWPASERTAVGQTRPLGDAAYPVVEREIHDATIALIVPDLRAAMGEVRAVETAHASIAHAGVHTVLAVRAAPEVSFGRVLSAVYTAALSGFDEPRLVLASAAGERELRVAGPHVDHAPSALGAALASATGIDAGVSGTRFSFTLDARGLSVQRGDAAPETIPVTPPAIDARFSGVEGPCEITFRAPRTTPYADVVAVLESLEAHGRVSLSAMSE